MEYFALIVVLIIVLIWRMRRNTRNLQKMCWVFLTHYILLGDERAKRGFEHVYRVFADAMKTEFRAVMDIKAVGIKATLLDTNKLDRLDLSEKNVRDLMPSVERRLGECSDFAKQNLSTKMSDLPKIYQATLQADPDMARAIKRSNLSFAKSTLPAGLDYSDYHEFLADVKKAGWL